MELFKLIRGIALAILKATFVLGAMYLLGKKIVPLIFSRIAKTSREILNLFTVLFIVLMVALFSYLGLSASVAAFIAGLLFGQTFQHYHIFSQIKPLRDLFAVLFFVSLGAQVKLFAILPFIVTIIIFSVVVILIKIIVATFIFIKFRFHTRTSLSLGILISNVGEFAFIILSLTYAQSIISESAFNLALATTLLTIIITPTLIKNRNNLYTRMRGFVRRFFPDISSYLQAHVDREPAHIDAIPLKNHVVICGYGRVGKYIGRALTMAKIPFIVVDYNYYTVIEARKHGLNIIYGDPTDIDILDYAQLEEAICMISAVPGTLSQEMIILNAKALNPRITIFTRVSQEVEQQRMKDLGAHVVIQPEFEASLSIVKKIYRAFKLPKDDIVGKIKRLKIEHGTG